jgi:hypothetical protein
MLPEELVEYRVCRHCGFRLMRVEPAISRVHPLTVMYCAVCGLSVDESGVRPGRKLNPQERRQAWEAWLIQQGLSLESLEMHYHMKYEDFFAPGVLDIW